MAGARNLSVPFTYDLISSAVPAIVINGRLELSIIWPLIFPLGFPVLGTRPWESPLLRRDSCKRYRSLVVWCRW